MTFAATPLLTRLRRYRGLWLLAFAALLLKLVTSSICLGDVPAGQHTVTSASTLSVAMTASTSDTATSDACLLGEAGSCHCACAHALTLTSQMVMTLTPLLALRHPTRLSFGLVPDTTGSLLRPPIA